MYKTLAELKAAYDRGDVKASLTLDNDQTSIYDYTGDGDPETDEDPNAWQKVFDMHPDDLLQQALDLLGIPWSYC
jgi:hypothetical protein